MKSSPKSSTKALTDRLLGLSHRAKQYAVVGFMLLLAAVYGFVLYRISELVSAQPSDSDVSDQIKTSATPHVDAKVVQQMQNLQDNSVRVQSLFDQARSNPFQE